MKKPVSFLLILCLILGLASSALADSGVPTFTQQPSNSTIDKYGNLSLIFKGEDFVPNESSWHFVDPETGNEWTGPQLRDEMKARKVTNFTLTASEGKQKLFLTGVPKFMHGWEVYVVLGNNGAKAESDHIHIYYNGLDPAKKYSEAKKDADQKAASSKDTKTTGGKATDGKATATDGTASAEPEVDPDAPKIITVTADKVTICPVDSRGNALEDQAATTLTFEDFGSVAVRSDSPVKYWIVNGIRIEPTDSLTGFVLKNITSDLTISAKFAKAASSSETVDMNTLYEVSCTGCTFTYHKGGLKSVTSGEVPSGATIIVFTSDAKAAAKGFSINGEAPENQGSTSFRLKIEEDTTISIP